jgi:hypothetical protein
MMSPDAIRKPNTPTSLEVKNQSPISPTASFARRNETKLALSVSVDRV